MSFQAFLCISAPFSKFPSLPGWPFKSRKEAASRECSQTVSAPSSVSPPVCAGWEATLGSASEGRGPGLLTDLSKCFHCSGKRSPPLTPTPKPCLRGRKSVWGGLFYRRLQEKERRDRSGCASASTEAGGKGTDVMSYEKTGSRHLQKEQKTRAGGPGGCVWSSRRTCGRRQV